MAFKSIDSSIFKNIFIFEKVFLNILHNFFHKRKPPKMKIFLIHVHFQTFISSQSTFLTFTQTFIMTNITWQFIHRFLKNMKIHILSKIETKIILAVTAEN